MDGFVGLLRLDRVYVDRKLDLDDQHPYNFQMIPNGFMNNFVSLLGENRTAVEKTTIAAIKEVL